VTEHVVQHQNLDLPRIHFSELLAHTNELRPRFQPATWIRTSKDIEIRVEALRSIHDGPFSPARAQSVQTDIGCDARRPRPQAASVRERSARQSKNYLLEGLLNEIVVIDATLPDDSIQSMIHRVDDTTGKLRRHVRVSTPNGRDDRFVADGRIFVRRARASAARNHPE